MTGMVAGPGGDAIELGHPDFVFPEMDGGRPYGLIISRAVHILAS